MFDFPKEIRRLIYTTNTVEGYHRQLRRVTKTKAAFPNAEAARQALDYARAPANSLYYECTSELFGQ